MFRHERSPQNSICDDPRRNVNSNQNVALDGILIMIIITIMIMIMILIMITIMIMNYKVPSLLAEHRHSTNWRD